MGVQLEAPAAFGSPFRIRVPFGLPKTLSLVVAILLVIDLSFQIAHYSGHALPYDIRLLFDVDEESSIPTWYSSAALLLAAGLLMGIAGAKKRMGDRDARYWYALVAGFALLSMEEIAAIHEEINTYTDFDWTILGAIVVLIVGPIFVKFLRRLDAPTRWRFVVAGAIYLGGVLGVEWAVAEPYLFPYRFDSLQYHLMASLEEGLEMGGIILFIRALLIHMRDMRSVGQPTDSERLDVDVGVAGPGDPVR